LLVGVALLGMAALAGLVFVHRPWPDRLDVWGFRLLPAAVHAPWADDFTKLGSMAVLLVGVLVVFVLGVRRDWVRAIGCATAPVMAVLIVEVIAKPLVGRPSVLSGGLSYPSGTVAAAVALATALTLVAPARARPLVALAGALVAVGTCAAVVVLRWHYPTDALGGVAVGMGSVLAVDALLHVPWALSRIDRPVWSRVGLRQDAGRPDVRRGDENARSRGLPVSA
jgi:membrane-associated phospholipid phosphatase